MLRTLFILLVCIYPLWSTESQLSWYSWKGFTKYKQHGISYFTQLPSSHRVFLSFSASEVKQLKNNLYERNQLSKLLKEAQARHITIELLLGDETYIYPQNHKKLLKLIDYFQQFSFQGIQLDIEPSALAKNERDIWHKEIVSLIAKVTKSTPLSVGLSLNHNLADKALLQKLQHSGLNEVVIMYYSINKDNVVKKLSKLMHEHKNLHFSLALSIEPISILSEDETYALYGQSRSLQIWKQIIEELASNGNFADLVIQSLEAFKKAKK